jgi:hypothetical protein
MWYSAPEYSMRNGRVMSAPCACVAPQYQWPVLKPEAREFLCLSRNALSQDLTPGSAGSSAAITKIQKNFSACPTTSNASAVLILRAGSTAERVRGNDHDQRRVGKSQPRSSRAVTIQAAGRIRQAPVSSTRAAAMCAGSATRAIPNCRPWRSRSFPREHSDGSTPQVMSRLMRALNSRELKGRL